MADEYWTKELIIKQLRFLYEKYGQFYSKDIESFAKKGLICWRGVITKKFGTVANGIKEAGISLIDVNNKRFTTENLTIILKEEFKNKPITLERLKVLSSQRKICSSVKLFKMFNVKGMIDLAKLLNLHIWDKEHALKSIQENLLNKNKKITVKNIEKLQKKGLLSVVKGLDGIKGIHKHLSIEYIKPKIKSKIKWPKELIISSLQKIYMKYGAFKKVDIDKFYREGLICSRDCIRFRFKSLDAVARIANIKFSPISKIGNNEETILNNIEKEKNIRILRQYNINKFFVDGYDPDNNTVYEVFEKCHSYPSSIKKDVWRQKIIQRKLNCNFIIIKDGWN